MLYGYAGTILRIDLNSGTFRKEPLSEIMAQNFIGGRGSGFRGSAQPLTAETASLIEKDTSTLQSLIREVQSSMYYGNLKR